MEASSHGLSPRLNRLGDVAFDVGVFMNVTHEHLEFHGTWEQYRDDKANLFRALDSHSPHRKTLASGPRPSIPSFGVACADDPSAPYFAAGHGRSGSSAFSTKGREADFRALEILSDESRGELRDPRPKAVRVPARIELPGAFNVDNALAALMAVSGILLAMDWADLVPLLPRLRPVLGRMTRVSRRPALRGDHRLCPHALVLPGRLPPPEGEGPGEDALRLRLRRERGTWESGPQQGRIAADYFRRRHPRRRGPPGGGPHGALLEMIAAGCPERRRDEDLFVIPDRPTAIRKAFELARPGDIVMLLGQGPREFHHLRRRGQPL